MDKASLTAVRGRIRRILRDNGGKFILKGQSQRLVEEIGKLQAASDLSVKAFGELIGLSHSQASYVNEKFKGQRTPKRQAALSAAKSKESVAVVPKFSEIRISTPEPVEVRTPGGFVLKFASTALAADFIRRCEQA